MAGAHTDALATENLTDVVRVCTLERERGQRAAVGGVERAMHAEAGKLGEALEQLSGERQLVCPDVVDPELLDEIDCRTESDRLGNLRRAASNLAGKDARVELASNTCLIMCPPLMKGGISSSSSRRPWSTPMPVGP